MKNIANSTKSKLATIRRTVTAISATVGAVTAFTRIPIVNAGLRAATGAAQSKLGKTLKIYDNAVAVRQTFDILEKINPKVRDFYNTRSFVSYVINRHFILPLDKYTFAEISCGNTIKDGSTSEEEGFNNWSLMLTIYGQNRIAIYDRICTEVFKDTENRILQFEVSGGASSDGYRSYMSKVIERGMDTIFLDDHIVEAITDDIDEFLSKRGTYITRGLPYKLGLLLYGQPGTGKSSLARAIASKYRMHLVNIAMSTLANMDLTAVAKAINADPDGTMYLILLDDIDCVFSNIDRDSDKADKEDLAIVDKLLAFLDSPSSPSNCIIMATTNYPERIDPSIVIPRNGEQAPAVRPAKMDSAITRAGRIDRRYYVTLIGKETAERMCRSFGLDDETIHKVLANESYPINPAYLQDRILSHIRPGADLVEVNE